MGTICKNKRQSVFDLNQKQYLPPRKRKMKLLLASSSIAVLLTGVDANFKLMKESYTALAKQLGNRNLLNTALANIDSYGCWCYFDDQVGNGKGEPMDLIDAECRNLHRGYECIVADLGAGCVPWTETYFPVLSTPFLSQFNNNAKAACDHANTVVVNLGACAAAACAVETQFTMDYTTITQSYNPQFSTYSHPSTNLGNFNPKRNCVTNDYGTPDKSERECCGTFPRRYPFKQYGGAHQCCDGTVFKIATHKCCSGTEVKLNNESC